ncbi:MAG TPA: hypothetical protein VEY51_08355 [Chondromyces sp.]|nr:hypothetical protein [Chondromyces sp.]
MEIYKKAYERYLEKCEMYGLECIQFHYFMKHLTEEQMQQLISEAN